MWGSGILVSPPSPWEKDFGLLPPSFGRRCPEGAEVGSRSGMRRKVRQPILPFRHPERSRGIFLVAAVYDMHAAAQKIARALISHSPFHQCARKISRFARNDDTEKAVLSFSAYLRRISPLAFLPRVPYPPLWGTFPSRGRLFIASGEAPLHFSFERASIGNHGLRRPWFPSISSPSMRPLSPPRPCRGRS